MKAVTFIVLAVGLTTLFYSQVTALGCVGMDTCLSLIDIGNTTHDCNTVNATLDCVIDYNNNSCPIDQHKTTFAKLKTAFSGICSDLETVNIPLDPDCQEYADCMGDHTLDETINQAANSSAWCGYMHKMVECQIQFGDLCWNNTGYAKKRELLQRIRNQRIAPICGINPEADRCLRNIECLQPMKDEGKAGCSTIPDLLQCMDDNRLVCPLDEHAANFSKLRETVTGICDELAKKKYKLEPSDCPEFSKCMEKKAIVAKGTKDWEMVNAFSKSENWCIYLKGDMQCQIENVKQCMDDDMESKKTFERLRDTKVTPVCGASGRADFLATIQAPVLAWISLVVVLLTRT